MKVYVRKSSSGEKLYDIVPVLNTRQGDKLIFSNSSAASQSDAELKANSVPESPNASSPDVRQTKDSDRRCVLLTYGWLR